MCLNPYNPKERLYKSGDHARYLSNGEMEYIGKVGPPGQNQRLRIELGELENRLIKHQSINEAVVIAREDKNRSKYLCAYIVSEERYL